MPLSPSGVALVSRLPNTSSAPSHPDDCEYLRHVAPGMLFDDGDDVSKLLEKKLHTREARDRSQGREEEGKGRGRGGARGKPGEGPEETPGEGQGERPGRGKRMGRGGAK